MEEKKSEIQEIKEEKETKFIRFILTFLLGWLGSLIINITNIKPKKWKSNTYAYFIFSILTLGIYGFVASIANFVFDEDKSNNIGYIENDESHFIKPFINGIFKQNPVFIGLLGLCSSLALTTTLTNAIGMGVSVIFVLTLSNLVISLLRKLVIEEIRTPIFIVIIASFVTVVQLILDAFIPSLYTSLGAFLSLIAVNCIILGRAESYASKNNPLDSVGDGLGMGIGYTLTLTVLALIRGILGNGTIELFSLRVKVLPASLTIPPLTTAMGAFIVFAILLSLINRYKFYKEDKENEVNK